MDGCMEKGSLLESTNLFSHLLYFPLVFLDLAKEPNGA